MNPRRAPTKVPPQRQKQQPGKERMMTPECVTDDPAYRAAGKLAGKVAIVTGGDSGIGKSVAIAFAKEGADVVLSFLPSEREDAQEVARRIQALGHKVVLVAADIGRPSTAKRIVKVALERFGHIDILVNNAGEQHMQDRLENISDEQLHSTFRTNIFSQFYLTRAVLPHLAEGSAIINTTSVTAYEGNPQLIDYSATKGAILAFTRALARSLAKKKIRVNAVAPGPIWTPLIPATFPPKKVAEFGQSTPMGRPGQPVEVATCYVFLASDDSSYITGQVLHPNGGKPVNG
jgi:NAD(P)-dependent dehydrogenase (short-subunit alcohol dehydrogenase family)